MIRSLPPWHENIGKRQVKRPKIYFRDSGIFHRLLGINDKSSLDVNPKLGSSWEGFALEEILRACQTKEGEAFFWGVHQQAELDLLLLKGTDRLGFEIKYTEAPKITRSHQDLVKILKLKKLFFIIPGEAEYPVSPEISVLGLKKIIEKPAL